MTIEEPAIEARMLSLAVGRKDEIAGGVFLFDLVDPEGSPLPAFDAGGHLVVVTPCGATRRYSIANAPIETNRYQIAVKREIAGGGGSVSLADKANVGTRLSVSHPVNHFALAHNLTRALLIAGGIGIAPIRSMAYSLAASGVPFDLVYCTASPETTAFRDELQQSGFADRVRFHHDHGEVARSLESASWPIEPAIGKHLYGCGPRVLMQAVRERTVDWPAGTVHFEDFGMADSSAPRPVRDDKAFKVVLARRGMTIDVAADISILEALRQRRVLVPSSCESGTCGACLTGLIAGVADHRDAVLDADDHDSAIMVCVSRSRSDVLELDL